MLTFGVSGVAELVLPHPHRPQHLQPVEGFLIVCRCGLALRGCRGRRSHLSVGQRQGGGLEEARVGG